MGGERGHIFFLLRPIFSSGMRPQARLYVGVAALLRRAAASLEQLDDVQIQDMTFQSEVTDGEDDLTMTVYYHPEPRGR